MIIHPQGSAEWHADRLGKITCSHLGNVLKSQTTKAYQNYMGELIGEILSGEAEGPPTTKAMQWGHDYEAEAVEQYQKATGNVCTEVGFIDHPTESRVGGSPDRLIGDDGGLEVKCPYGTKKHVEYLLGECLPKEHEAQVQGGMWVTGRQWWDFVSYTPRIPDPKIGLFIVRVPRNQTYIDILEHRVGAFREQLLAHLKTIMKGLSE